MSTVMDTDNVGLIRGVRSLWEGNVLVDYTIEVEDQEFKVHKVILAATSEYFNAMLTGRMTESQTDRVRLEGVTPLAVSNIINLIYTGYFSATKPDVEELLACAMYLQVPRAISECKMLASYGRNPQNSFKLLSMLQTYSASEETVKYITSHFDEVYAAWKPDKMTKTDINNLVDLWQKSEWELFLAIKRWLDVDREHRQQHLSELMNRLRFALMALEQLEAVKASDLYSIYKGSWCENVDKAIQYNNLPTHAKVLDDSEQSQVREEPHPFYFDSRCNFCYKLKQDASFTQEDDFHEYKPRKSWETCKALEKPEIKHGIEACVIVNNFLIVCEECSTEQKWHILDPRTMKWSSMANLSMPREDFSLVSCNKHIYVLGGSRQGAAQYETNIIEKYDFEADSWSIIPSRLPIPMSEHGAAVIDGCIYVADGEGSGRLDCLDTSSGTWHSKASLPLADEIFRSLQVMEYCDEKVLFIMFYRLEIQYYSPSQDMWFKLKCNIKCGSSRLKWHPNATVLSDQKSTLYLLNFKLKRDMFCERDKYTEKQCYRYRTTGQCAQWTFSSKGEITIDEKWLQDCPVDNKGKKENDRKFMRLMLLAVPPQTTAPSSGC